MFGWRVEGYFPKDIKKYVVISAPHTTIWEYVIAVFYYTSRKMKVHFLIKKEFFFFPLGIILRKFGGIPVDRKNPRNIVEQLVRMFNKNESMYLTITPEGTRKPVTHWKRGFYYIARRANVPIVICYLDFRKKIISLGSLFYPTGNIDEDMKIIKQYYTGVTAKYPENFATGLEETEL